MPWPSWLTSLHPEGIPQPSGISLAHKGHSSLEIPRVRNWGEATHHHRCSSLPGSQGVTRIFRALCLEQVGVVVTLSRLVTSRLWETPWTAAPQDPLSVGFSRQEYRRGFPSPPPGDLPHPGAEHTSPALLHRQAGSLAPSHWEAHQDWRQGQMPLFHRVTQRTRTEDGEVDFRGRREELSGPQPGGGVAVRLAQCSGP